MMGDTEERQDEVQRWTAKRRAAVVLEILKGNTTLAEAARTRGLTAAEVEGAVSGGCGELPEESSPGRREQKDERIRRLERKVGRMALELDILQEAMKPN